MHDLDGFLEFCAVVDHGGFTRAGEALGVSTSFVSRRVAELETRLGVRLLHRTTRSVNLTDLGAQYHERARAILDDIHALSADMAEQQNKVKGRIRITAGGRIGEGIVTDRLCSFATRHPEAELELEICERRVDLIREGYDLAIRHGMERDPDLIIRRIDTRRLIVCASPAYVAEHGAPSIPEDLAQMRCIGAPGQRWQFHRERRPFEVKVPTRWRSNNGPALARACVSGLGLARLADTYVGRPLRDGRLVPFLEDFELPPQEIVLVYPSRDNLPYRVRALINHLIAPREQSVGDGALRWASI